MSYNPKVFTPYNIYTLSDMCVPYCNTYVDAYSKLYIAWISVYWKVCVQLRSHGIYIQMHVCTYIHILCLL